MTDNLEVKKDDIKVDDEIVEYNGYKIPKTLKDQINGRVAAEKSALKTQLDEILTKEKSDKEKLSAELDNLRKSLMSEKERNETEEAERTQKLLKLEEYGNRGWDLFKQTKIQNDTLVELGKYNVYNPMQVMALLKAQNQVDVIEKDGDFTTIFKNGDKQISVGDAVKSFLELPENANLLKSTVKGGSGTGESRDVKIQSGTLSPEEKMKQKFDELNKKN